MHDPSLSYSDLLAVIVGPADAHPRPLDVQVWRGSTDGSVGMSVHGVMDVATVPDLSRALAAMTPRGTPLLIVDLDGVTHLGACGLGMLVAIRRRMTSRGDRMRLSYAPGGHSHRALALTHLDTVFPPAA